MKMTMAHRQCAQPELHSGGFYALLFGLRTGSKSASADRISALTQNFFLLRLSDLA